jgi:23S rRNA pseudouridine2604 synthase
LTGRGILRKPAGTPGSRPEVARSTRAKRAQKARGPASAKSQSSAPATKSSPYGSAVRAAAHPPALSSPVTAPKPLPPPEEHKVRVSKLMSERGLCSRREADEYIERGWVYVDGVRVEELGTRIDPSQTITLDKKAENISRVTILLHKPVGYVSGQPEPGYRPASTLIVPDNRFAGDNPSLRFEREHLKGLAPAGRLDIDSTGLLVFTQDGRVAKLLIGEDSTIEKEYLVRVEGSLDDKGLKLLNHGLSLDDLPLKPAQVTWQNRDQLRFVLREGKKRQIRRMCELVGLNVTGLKRVRIGRIALGELPPGQWRYLHGYEKF